MVLTILSLQMLNINWDIVLNDEQFLGHYILQYVGNTYMYMELFNCIPFYFRNHLALFR